MAVRRPSPSAVLLTAVAVVVLLSGCDATPLPGTQPSASSTAAATPDPTTPDTMSGTNPAPPSGTNPAPRSSSTPTPTPSVRPTPASSARAADNLPVPPAPDVANELSPEGLEAFTSYWLALLSYSYEANDLSPLLAVSDPACGFCAGAVESMAQLYRTAWASGGATTLTSFATDVAADDAGTYTADITTSQTEIFYYSVEGWLGSSESKPNTPHTVTARYLDGRWQLTDYSTPAAG